MAFEGLFGATIAPEVDILLDGRAIDIVDPDALEVLFTWLAKRGSDIAKRVRLQVGVIPEGLLGVTLAGILPALGSSHHPFVVERDHLAALRVIAPDDAEALAEELSLAVAEASGLSPLMRRLRDLLRERCADLVVDDAARALGLSTRTLQRSLKTEGTSFQDELRDARVDRAASLLRSTDDKLASIAARIGVNEGTLAELIRDRFGMTPAEYRRTSHQG